MNSLSTPIFGLALFVLGGGAILVCDTLPHMNVQSDHWQDTEMSAQSRRDRPRIRVQPVEPPAYDYPRPNDHSWPGPGAVRQCVDWYVIEHRPSGPVVTPRMRCRWIRG